MISHLVDSTCARIFLAPNLFLQLSPRLREGATPEPGFRIPSEIDRIQIQPLVSNRIRIQILNFFNRFWIYLLLIYALCNKYLHLKPINPSINECGERALFFYLTFTPHEPTLSSTAYFEGANLSSRAFFFQSLQQFNQMPWTRDSGTGSGS